jgi:hypothetical protein
VYFAEQPPAVEIRGGLAFIRPDGTHCEIALTPHTLGQFIAKANRALDQFHDFRGVVVPLAVNGPR